MNINDFCIACEGARDKTQIFWHSTGYVSDEELKTGILKPHSLDLGNAFNKPGLSIYMWKTYNEAVTWSVYDMLCQFQYWLSELREMNSLTTGNIYDEIFEKDQMLKDYDNFTFEIWWDRNKRKCIIPARDSDELNNAMKYFDKHEISHIMLMLQTRSKYVSIGQTAALKEYTTRDPETKILDVVKIRIDKKLIKESCEVVPDAYFDDQYAICDASLMNRGLASFFNVNEFEFNRRFNNDNIYKLKQAALRGEVQTEKDVAEYMKKNNIKILKLNPIERVRLAMRGNRYIKKKYN